MDLISDLLQKQLQEITSIEDELLKKINLGTSNKKRKLYYQLIEKRKAEMLKPIEYQQLIGISHEIEVANAERMKYLVQLAQVRGVSLKILMEGLGIVTK